MNLKAAIFGAGVALSLGITGAWAGSAPHPMAAPAAGQAEAIFAGGCFWCMEPPFDKLDGVISTTSGYTSGMRVNPTYEEVSAGKTGHTEALKIVYDPSKITYEKLLQVFWRNHDPLTANAQFCDKGSQYRAGIYYGNDEEKRLAESTKAAIAQSGRFTQPIATEIVAATTFYPAEDYHQDYYIKNPIKYKYYSTSCGRARRLNELWGDEAGGQS
jgi:peptide-methionine (S)-S-oxide reductase